ncbi:phage integrase SAM-like domain-containing protein [Natronococcus sp. A-GB1]|uniref:tyrosine-type recombinase/integrase n=1 Tax=Natronococcus sp. A-GB1 TaxID=3037648 RepID=UPI00241FA21B|nr:site-specific integrase [Natronococcus sp. A-GB1]MDG5760153.1 phage integrase SAM-like domain-containing protein [Natronococcus sp. A-GB1]
MTGGDRRLTELEQVLSGQSTTLQSLTPAAGIDRYLDSRGSTVTPKTINEYRRKLAYFREFCDRREIADLNELDGRLVDTYRVWRRDEATDTIASLSPKTMRDEMYLFRAFLRYLERIEAVRPGLADTVVIPRLGETDGVRSTELAPERVATIITYLETYRYASRDHVIWLLHCRTGRRPGAIHSLDVTDVHCDEAPYLAFRHRPEQGTRLKNGRNSERDIPITDEVATVLDDYIEHAREPVTDEYDRKPLLASRHGRLSKTAMRLSFYAWSRPCTVTGECPHDKQIESCPAAQSKHDASKCPSSQSSYAARHGHITHLRRLGLPKSVVSDRCDVSEEIIEKHYDERSEADRRKLHRDLLENLRETHGDDTGYI